MATFKIVDSYHELKTTANQEGVALTLQCVSCANIHPRTSTPYPLMGYNLSSLASRNGAHEAHVLPCGHLMGKSCIDFTKEDRCPKCNVLFRRNNNPTNCCVHAIELPKLSMTRLLSPEEEGCLLPRTAGADMHKRCRGCATMKCLLQLTTWARDHVSSQLDGAQSGDSIYATDGKLNGFHPGDCLQPLKYLDLPVKPPIITEDLASIARGYTKDLRLEYDERTPPVENKMVGHKDIAFKVGGYTAQKCLQRREQEAKLAPLNQ